MVACLSANQYSISGTASVIQWRVRPSSSDVRRNDVYKFGSLDDDIVV